MTSYRSQQGEGDFKTLVTNSNVTYLLTPWSGVYPEKLTGSQLVKKFSAFLEPECSLPHSQVPFICPYHEPPRSSPYSHISLPEDPS